MRNETTKLVEWMHLVFSYCGHVFVRADSEHILLPEYGFLHYNCCFIKYFFAFSFHVIALFTLYSEISRERSIHTLNAEPEIVELMIFVFQDYLHFCNLSVVSSFTPEDMLLSHIIKTYFLLADCAVQNSSKV